MDIKVLNLFNQWLKEGVILGSWLTGMNEQTLALLPLLRSAFFIHAWVMVFAAME